MSERKAYHDKMQARVAQWQAEADKLLAQAREKQAEGGIALEQTLRELRHKRETVANKLQRLEQAGEERWEQVRAELDGAWDQLQDAWKSLTGRLGDGEKPAS